MPSKTIPTENNQNRPSGWLNATLHKQPEQGLKCPRCDSINTKFCYYNNYNLKQPRYFCKGCRRYWTKGGALRTIPFGGISRRRKTTKSSNSKHVLENDHLSGGFQRFQDFKMDCQLATPTSTTTSVLSNSSVGQDQLHFTLSSIESLSAINQDLYWKLQQQRLALLFGGQNNDNIINNNDTQKEETNNFIPYFPLQNNNNDNYCSTRDQGENDNLVTEWLFDTCSFETVDPFAGDNWCNDGGIIEETNSWINEMQGWEEFNQYGLIMP